MSSPEAFYLATQGYFDKIKDQAYLHRNVAYINYCLQVEQNKRIPIEQFWSLDEVSKEKDTYILPDELRKLIIEKHGLKK